MIYVAHPYNNLVSNKRSVEMIIKELSLKNPSKVYVSPIHTFGFMYNTVSYEKGMYYCKSLLAECDSVIFCKGWETSRGCKLEMEYCLEHGVRWEEIS